MIFTLDASEQELYVSIDKNRGGKEVTLVEGFIGNSEDLKELEIFKEQVWSWALKTMS